MDDWINTPNIITENTIGFVYQITERDTGMIYIGIKKFWKIIKLKPLKGKKNKRHKTQETDWRIYNSSNKELEAKIKKNPNNYKKEIIRLCKSITEMKAYEAYYQLDYYVSGNWNKLYNEMINLRVRIRKN